MIRVVVLAGVAYGREVINIEDDMNAIQTFIEEGTPVILAEDTEDLCALGIDDVQRVD